MYFRKDLRSSMTKFVEDNRNWSLFAAQLSFVCFSCLENHVPRVACKMFSILIHYLYMAFFLWTGNVMNTIMNISLINKLFISAIEGYQIMKNLLTPLDLKRYSLKIYLLFGYGLPALFSATVTLTFSSKYEIFIREDSEGDILACFVSLSAMWIVALPACTKFYLQTNE